MKALPTIGALAGLAVALLGANCTPAKPRIKPVEPAVGSTVTWAPIDVVFDLAQSVDVGTLLVELNGTDVTGFFQVGPPVGGRILVSADRLWLDGALLQGPNVVRLEARFNGNVVSRSVPFEAEGDAYADALVQYTAGSGGGFGASGLPDVVTGPPSGAGYFQGSFDVVSLGLGGSIELEFVDNVVVDGPGFDLTIFENAFLTLLGLITDSVFSEPGRVLVSQDGVGWVAFPCALDVLEHPLYPGCAGVYPVLSNALYPATGHASIPSETPVDDLLGVDATTLVPEGSGGDSFDLADVGLTWARFVRIEAAPFVVGPVGADTAGFDLDAVVAARSAPATDLNGNGIPDAVE